MITITTELPYGFHWPSAALMLLLIIAGYWVLTRLRKIGDRSHAESEFVMEIRGTGDHGRVIVSYDEKVTTQQMDNILRQALIERGKVDPVLIRLLFHNVLLAMGEDDNFRQWYEEETGIDLREVVEQREES